jgi:hypothetical protein
MRNPSRFLFSLLTVVGLAGPAGAQAQVSAQRIERAAAEPQNWLTNHGGYDSKRYSTLNQITPANVKDLEQKWVVQDQVFGAWESNPLVVDGIMYLTERPNDVMAVDAKTGKLFWLYRYTPSPDARVCCGANNRGVAMLGDTLYMGTLDAHLVAIDARNGHLLWNIPVADVKLAYSITMAPLIVKAHTGQLRFIDIFEQQQEARTILPKLIFLLSAARGHWDVRDLMMLSVTSCWLTVAGIFVLLRRAGLGLGAVAICFWLIVLTVSSPAQFELWIFASGFPSFLPALFLVVALAGAGTLRSTGARFLACAGLAIASSFTLANGLLAWGLTFPALLLMQRSSRWRSTTSATRRSRSRARRQGSSPTRATARRGSSKCGVDACTRRSSRGRSRSSPASRASRRRGT